MELEAEKLERMTLDAAKLVEEVLRQHPFVLTLGDDEGTENADGEIAEGTENADGETSGPLFHVHQLKLPGAAEEHLRVLGFDGVMVRIKNGEPIFFHCEGDEKNTYNDTWPLFIFTAVRLFPRTMACAALVPKTVLNTYGVDIRGGSGPYERPAAKEEWVYDPDLRRVIQIVETSQSSDHNEDPTLRSVFFFVTPRDIVDFYYVTFEKVIDLTKKTVFCRPVTQICRYKYEWVTVEKTHFVPGGTETENGHGAEFAKHLNVRVSETKHVESPYLRKDLDLSELPERFSHAVNGQVVPVGTNDPKEDMEIISKMKWDDSTYATCTHRTTLLIDGRKIFRTQLVDNLYDSRPVVASHGYGIRQAHVVLPNHPELWHFMCLRHSFPARPGATKIFEANRKSLWHLFMVRYGSDAPDVTHASGGFKELFNLFGRFLEPVENTLHDENDDLFETADRQYEEEMPYMQ